MSLIRYTFITYFLSLALSILKQAFYLNTLVKFGDYCFPLRKSVLICFLELVKVEQYDQNYQFGDNKSRICE